MNKIKLSIKINPDQDGYTGRECPKCEHYFKIKFGTGIQEVIPCYCPYCGHVGEQDTFWTKEQIEYVKSYALNRMTGDILKRLKKIEVRPNPRALFSIGIKVKGRASPIRYYTERELEQKIVCNKCSLEYTIYGVFGFCPDCGTHNSLQIFFVNLDIIQKMLCLASQESNELQRKLVENALEDVVAAFDGFGRECYTVYAQKTNIPHKVQNISFQNIQSANEKLKANFSIDLSSLVKLSDWQKIHAQFQKRHLLAHKMGIIDNKYVQQTGISHTMVGRKIEIPEEEVQFLISSLRSLATYMFQEFSNYVAKDSSDH